MDAIFLGCLKAVHEHLPGSTWVDTAAEFAAAFDGQRVVVVNPAQCDPVDVGFAAVLAVTADGTVGDWRVDDLVHPDTPVPVLAERVRRWVDRKAANARLVHDLRAPVGVLMGNCQLLMEGLCGPITPRQEKALAAMERAVERFVVEIERAR